MKNLVPHAGPRLLRRLRDTAAACSLFLILSGCGSDLPSSCPRGKPVASVKAISSTEVEVSFACQLSGASAADPDKYEITDYTTLEGTPATHPRVAVQDAEEADGTVTLTTGEQTALTNYTLTLSGVRDAAGNEHSASTNFSGLGKTNSAEVTLMVDDRYNTNLTEVWLLTSVDPVTGRFTHKTHRIALVDPDKDHVFTAKLKVARDPARTMDTKDDRYGTQFMAYSVRAVDAKNRSLSKLVLFEVKDTKAKTVKVPLLTVPDKPPVEGRVMVTFKVDDRQARALNKPTLKGSFDKDGKFDATFPTALSLSDKDGDNVWEATAQVWIDPSRTLTGSTASAKPYSVYLVESGTSYTTRSADFVVPQEKPVSVSILVGSTDKVPVTFRVDVSKAWLDTDGLNKGVWSGESVFLTGEFGSAEDAFGQNATDAFSGGENVVLQMVERQDRKGVWERTIFLPKTKSERPYGWKVVRCPTDKGCTQLNKMVSSSGKAFPTVMKNLVTELCDAAKKKWTDKECKSPRVIDPRNLTKVVTGAGTLNYSSAKIWAGTGAGLKDQQDPPGTPKSSLMFKQEIPDLVVNVKDTAVESPVYVIGSWRDVNITGTPKDIISGGKVTDLDKTDYDAGLSGAAPPSYKLAPAPKPSPFKMDGKVDSSATLVAGGTKGNGGMSIHVGISGNHLYLATDDAGEGSDNFILVSATKPGTMRAAPWGKAGKVAFGGKTLFAADENDNSYAGWFELGGAGAGKDKELEAMGSNKSAALDIFAPTVNGGVVEGTIDLKAVFGKVPTVIYLAAAPWVNTDKGKLYQAAQTPKTKNGDGNIDASEILKVSIPSLKVLP